MKTQNLKTLQNSYFGRNEKITRNLFCAAKVIPLILGVFFFITSFIHTGRMFSGISVFIYCCLISLLPVIIIDKRQKKIWKRFSEAEIDRIDKQCLTSKHIGPLLITQDAVVYLSGSGIITLPIRDIVWIYEEELTWRKGMISNVSYSLRIVLRDKTAYTVFKSNVSEHKIIKDAIQFLKENLREQRPNLLFGYSDEHKKLYASQFHHMVKTADGEK